MSSTIEFIAYDDDANVLIVSFVDGSQYKFNDVPILVYRTFAAAASKGTYFNDFIRDGFDCERLEGPTKHRSPRR